MWYCKYIFLSFVHLFVRSFVRVFCYCECFSLCVCILYISLLFNSYDPMRIKLQTRWFCILCSLSFCFDMLYVLVFGNIPGFDAFFPFLLLLLSTKKHYVVSHFQCCFNSLCTNITWY